MNAELRTLIDLQALDSKISGLDAQVARLPQEIAAVHAAVKEAKEAVEAGKTKLDAARKNQRAKEKDLEDNRVKRQKFEGQLYQVKTNKEYSAVLAEIEEVKQEKARIEEEILNLMELGERLAGEVKEAEARFKAREAQGRVEETELQEKLRAVEGELSVLRDERAKLAREVSASVLADYDKLLRHRGVAVAEVTKPNFCGGCRVTMTPQRLQELRQQNTLIHCESCGRYLYWVA
ncbi:MAG TPA: C4-type zinc ribbon domain-containing protein [Methylomirabilota bacterium]|nr:C4-type zinc ribbon domain-containing protein [Methylomirabilota bacterium]